MKKDGKSTHGQIIKSSALIGGSTMVNVGLGMIRTKVMAHLLSTAGIGLFGNYGTISDLVRTVAGMGLNVSGVRQIAEAVGTGEQRQIARTVVALRRVAMFTGAVGALVLVIFCKPVSWMMFNDGHHAGAIALLAAAVFFADVSAGQMALIQGMRRISDLARLTIWGAIYGTAFSIPIVWVWGSAGVVPSLVCAAAMTILTSWWYARKVKVEQMSLTWKETFGEASGLLKMGVIFMSSGFMSMGAAFAVRAIITRRLGLDSAGLYQSAWVLGGVYTGYILQAMGADFFPRLTASVRDNEACNRLVNEQVEVGVLVAAPGVLATLSFTPWIIQVFYTAKFGLAVELLRWICLGTLLRVVSWPMGYFLVARGERKIYFWSEMVFNLLYIGLIWLGVEEFRLTGTGIAFFGMYVLYTIGSYMIVHRLSGFRWSAANLRLGACFVPLVAAVFAGEHFLSPKMAVMFGGGVTLLAGIFSLRTVCTLIPMQRLPRAAQKLLALCRLAPVAEGI